MVIIVCAITTWPRPSPVYKGPQQWDAGAQPKEQVERLEVAGDSWEATLLQLCKLLAMHTGGATGTWGQLRRRRRKVKQAKGGGKRGRAVQEWRRLLRSYLHQQRRRRQQREMEAEVEEA